MVRENISAATHKKAQILYFIKRIMDKFDWRLPYIDWRDVRKVILFRISVYKFTTPSEGIVWAKSWLIDPHRVLFHCFLKISPLRGITFPITKYNWRSLILKMGVVFSNFGLYTLPFFQIEAL